MSVQINFTKTSLSALPEAPKGKRSYYLDSNKKSGDLKGFGLVVNDRGKKHFVLTQYFKRDKKTVRLRCGEFPSVTIEQARKVAKQFQYALLSGIHPTEERKRQELERRVQKENLRLGRVTLNAVLDDYLANKDLKPSTKVDYKKVIAEIWRDWLEKPLIDISDDLVKDRYRRRVKVSKARANYNMRVLRALFNFARIEYRLPDGSVIFERNPVDVISEGKMWHKVEPRKRRLQKQEIAGWLEAVDSLESQVSAAYLKFLLFTGARRGEAARLLTKDVDFDRSLFTLRDPKNRRDATLPMSEYVRVTLSELIGANSKWIFSSPVNDGHLKDPRKAIKRVVQASGVEFSLHDLRRTFIAVAEGLDISHYAIKALVNHTVAQSSDITAGYLDVAHDYDRMRQATEKVSNRILSLAHAPDGKVMQFSAKR